MPVFKRQDYTEVITTFFEKKTLLGEAFKVTREYTIAASTNAILEINIPAGVIFGLRNINLNFGTVRTGYLQLRKSPTVSTPGTSLITSFNYFQGSTKTMQTTFAYDGTGMSGGDTLLKTNFGGTLIVSNTPSYGALETDWLFDGGEAGIKACLNIMNSETSNSLTIGVNFDCYELS